MKLNEFNSLIDLFFYQSKKQRFNDVFLEWLNPHNQKRFTWGEVTSNIYKLSKVIKESIKSGDRCLLVSENRPEWLISDLAIMLANGITVPAYTTYTENDYEYLINDCEPSVIIISNENIFKKLEKTINKKEFIKKIIIFDKINIQNNSLRVKNLNSLINFELKENDKTINQNLKRNDPACIIYTSGTSGNPKGVILSHGGILNNCEGALELLKPLIKEKPVFLTWLPLSHSYEHTVQFVQIAVGAKIYYAEKIEKLLDNISESRPTIMTAVPRFYQNLSNKIKINFDKQTGLKSKLIKKTISLGIKKISKINMSFSEKLINYILDILVRKKVKKQFGGRLKAFVSGGGPLDKDIGEFLNAIGLPTLQGYGLTEASPVVSCNSIDNIKVDTVGLPFKGNKIKIADDGEILVKGENVMLGYWKNPEATNKTIIDGWLHTGDIGEIDPENGYLKITDRKKDIIVTSGGDNISPAKIENMITLFEEIEQCMVYGDNKKYLVALIVPNKDFVNQIKKIDEKITQINKKLTQIEKIKKYFIVNENFTIENDLLTPTMKVKRNKVIKKYKDNFEKLYTT